VGAGALNPKGEAKSFDIAQHVAPVQRRLCRYREQKRLRLAVEVCNVVVDEWQATGQCLTTETQAVTELKVIDRMEQRIFAAVQPGEEIKYQPGFGNRNLFYALGAVRSPEGFI
jgi:hypothetical protein